MINLSNHKSISEHDIMKSVDLYKGALRRKEKGSQAEHSSDTSSKMAFTIYQSNHCQRYKTKFKRPRLANGYLKPQLVKISFPQDKQNSG